MQARTFVRAVVGSAALLSLGLLTASAGGQAGGPQGVVVVKGLNGPQGVLVAPDGSVWVADSGMGGATTFEIPGENGAPASKGSYGDTGQIVKLAPDGTRSVVATLPSVAGGEEATAGGRLALIGDTVYVANGDWSDMLGTLSKAAQPPKLSAVLSVKGGEVASVANTWAFESANNPDKGQAYPSDKDSHPYGLTAGPDGLLYIADAGANDILKLDPATGKLSLFAVLGPVAQPLGLNKANVPTQPVPTGMAFGADGAMYVSLLSGGPFTPGTAKVVKIAKDGKQTDFATGLTMLTDLRRGPDGNFYAVSFGQFGEQGPLPNAGAIVRIKPDGTHQTVLGGLSFPTSIDFNKNGDAFIAVNGVGAPGSGEVVRYDGLTKFAGK